MVREGGVPAERRLIRSPEDVFNVAQGFLGDADREYFLTLTLNTKNYVTGINVVSIGSLNSSLVHPREVFKLAVLGNAAAIVLVHNHRRMNMLTPDFSHDILSTA